MHKFCYKCGALEEDKGPLIDGLCQKCFVAEHPLLQVAQRIGLKVCRMCGAHFIDNEWRELEKESGSALKEGAEEAVLSELTVARKGPTGIQYVNPAEVDNVRVKLESELVPPNVRVNVEASGKIDESQKKEQNERTEVSVNIDMTTCKICSRKTSGYYEAILQVRGRDSLSEKRIAGLYKVMENRVMEEHKRDRNAFVSKIERKHGGLDFYVSSTDLARHMAELLKSKYGAKINESAKLIGKTKDGRDKYRIKVIARLP